MISGKATLNMDRVLKASIYQVGFKVEFFVEQNGYFEVYSCDLLEYK